MKKLTLIILLFANWCFAQQQTITHSVSPTPFEESDNITITIQGSSVNEVTWGITGNALYLWAWSYDTNLSNQQDCPTNGDWTNSSETNRFTYNGGSDTYTISLVPTSFFSRTGIGRIGFLVKAKDGTGDKKSQDILEDVGAFQLSLSSPTDSTTILTSGSNLSISASNTGGNADYVLKVDGTTINSQSGIASYSYTDMNITSNKNYTLEATVGGVTKSKDFSVIVDPGTNFSVMPQTYSDGITYDDSDPTKATLVLYATGKDFVYVAGSFNNWQPGSSYAMNRDPSRNNKFWITLTGLTPGQIETFQYWAVDKSPIANSPALVKTADPYSTLVLSPFDDPFIPASTYPSLPTYPARQEREVTVLQTGKTPYNWQITNFNKPKKEDLVIYEVLIRDFDVDRNYQDVIDKIDYFKNLNINAIELMPVMEFEGNESWGYNTSFHMALDKFYGTEDKFKELVDVCHQNGIAVILDLALNHAFGRNPMVRMWMNDPDNDGWGEPSSENPYFNETARHSYSVGSDFDHSNSFTQLYTKRVVKHWIEEFNIDGFRWDLTKGFTQNCTSGDEGCTNSFQQDRVDVLKEYADYSWSLDETHYVIFEHLGGDSEEQQWANYRIGDAIPKGIMMWSEMWTPYKNLTQGQSSNINFDRMGHTAHGFTEKRILGFPESHDKDRIMYEMTQFGNSSGGYDIKDLNTALERMSALGAISLTVPGPKMVWHFADLGMEDSIWTCSNGVVNSDYDGNGDGDCKLDTKPQPQWINNWLGNANRSQVYSDWSRLNALKVNEAVFEGDYNITSGTQTPRISIYTGSENTSGSELKNVIVMANFSVTNQTINPNFPYSGDWYDLMDESATPATIDGSITSINLAPGEFRVYGNQESTLSVYTINNQIDLKLFPNPTNDSFSVNKNSTTLNIYSITGKRVKTFKGNFQKGYTFDISNLKQSLYLVKVINDLEEVSTIKLIKI